MNSISCCTWALLAAAAAWPEKLSQPVRALAATAADRMNAIGRLKRMICLLCTKKYTFPVCGPIVPFAAKRLIGGAFSCILNL